MTVTLCSLSDDGVRATVLALAARSCNRTSPEIPWHQRVKAAADRDELGAHVQTARSTLRDAGVKLSERNATFSDDELQIIRRLRAEATRRHDFVIKVVVDYCNGSTQQQIAAELEVHVRTVRATLREAGVKVGERSATFSDEELRTIRRLHADGISARELGRRYGVAHTTILRQLR